MECNKDEAVRAKEIAENKFKTNDIAGANKFALKAQSLYPELDGISQMLATFDVYIAAEKKVNNNKEFDWYGILNASLTDDHETLKKKYKKLALSLHPDKNNSIGADGAFRHVSDAWKFLSDKDKRALYDRNRSLQSIYQKVSVSVSSSNNFAKTAGFTTSNARTTTTTTSTKPPNYPQKQTAAAAAPTSSDQSKSTTTTFWTVCRRCMMQYEYLSIYVNCELLCPSCLQYFPAIQYPQPQSMLRHWTSSSSSLKRNHFNDNSKWTFSSTNSPAQAANLVQQTYEKVKKEREELRRVRKNAKRKNNNTDDSSSSTCLKKKRKVVGETDDLSCSAGRKVTTYYVTGETGKLHHVVTKEKAEEADNNSSPRIKKKISKERVKREKKVAR